MVAGCKQKIAEWLMTFVCKLTLTYYGKQRRRFEFLLTWLSLNLTCYYFGFGATAILNLK